MDTRTLTGEVDEFIEALELDLTAEETDVARLLIGVFYAGVDVWRLAEVAHLSIPVVRFYMTQLERARLWRSLPDGAWEFRSRWMDDLQSDDPKSAEIGRIGFYLQVTAATGMTEVSWDEDEPGFRLHPGWVAPPPSARRCRVCARINGYYRDVSCSPECAQAWVALRIHIDPHQATRHRRSCAKAVLGNPAAGTTPAIRRLSEAVLAGTAPDRNRRFVVPGSSAAQWAARFSIDLGYGPHARQPTEACPVPNLDRSRCQRMIRGDQLACHIHRPTAARAERVEEITLAVERELVAVLW